MVDKHHLDTEESGAMVANLKAMSSLDLVKEMYNTNDLAEYGV